MSAMNRRDFLKAMRRSLQERIVETATPIVEDELRKAQSEWIILNGMRWQEVAISNSHLPTICWLDKKPIIFLKRSNGLQAYSCLCQHCNTPLHYQAYSEKIICFTCYVQWGIEEMI